MVPDESQKALGLTFDRVAGAYERARPAYPPRLVDRAIERAGEEAANEWLDLFRTTALYQRIEAARRPALEEDARELIEQQGGLARSSIATVLVTARRSRL